MFFFKPCCSVFSPMKCFLTTLNSPRPGCSLLCPTEHIPLLIDSTFIELESVLSARDTKIISTIPSSRFRKREENNLIITTKRKKDLVLSAPGTRQCRGQPYPNSRVGSLHRNYSLTYRAPLPHGKPRGFMFPIFSPKVSP